MEQFDFVTLIFIVIAVVVFVKLISILGTRQGHEQPPVTPLNRDRADKGDSSSSQIRDRIAAQKAHEEQEALLESNADLVERYAGDRHELRDQLLGVVKSYAQFDPEDFVEGAASAYEDILIKFADANISGLKQLVAKPVLDKMQQALDGFESNDYRVEFQFIGLKKTEIKSASVAKGLINVTIVFVSNVIMAVEDTDGKVVSGHPTQVQERIDRWTFERSSRSKKPGWKIIRTESLDPKSSTAN